MRFRITNQYAKGPENPLAEFTQEADADLFANNKIQQDMAMLVKVTYRLYDSFDLVKEYDASAASAAGGSGDSSSSGQAGKGASFKPTPFNMAPTPTGMPKNWWGKDEDEDKDK